MGMAYLFCAQSSELYVDSIGCIHKGSQMMPLQIMPPEKQ